MTAGLPGFAIGGLFFVVSALLMPFVELVHAARGRSTPARRRAVAGQAALAAAILVSVERVVWLGRFLRSLASSGGGPAAPAATTVAFPVVPVLATAACLGAVLLLSYAHLVARGGTAATPEAGGPAGRDRARAA